MMCGLCFCTSLFSVRIKITFLFCSIYLKRIENMNKETRIQSMYCFVQVQFGLKNREIGYFCYNKALG